MAEPRSISDRLAGVRARIDAACARAGRKPESVTLVAVSKRQPVERVRQMLDCGVLDLGENYAQALRPRRETFPEARWHFIGHLQRNKVKLVVPCTLLHSVDSVRLVQAVAKRANAASTVQDVLVEVGTGEATKTGAAAEEVVAICRAVLAEPALRLKGLMGMAPWGSEDDEARECFIAVRTLRDELEQQLGVALPELSMGMSGDLEVAIEEGATLVRVGEALFGPREARQ